VKSRRYPLGVGKLAQHTFIGSRRRRNMRAIRATRHFEAEFVIGPRGYPVPAPYLYRYCLHCGAHLGTSRADSLYGYCVWCRDHGLLTSAQRQQMRETMWEWGKPSPKPLERLPQHIPRTARETLDQEAEEARVRRCLEILQRNTTSARTILAFIQRHGEGRVEAPNFVCHYSWLEPLRRRCLGIRE
jgi:hypothetical protein